MRVQLGFALCGAGALIFLLGVLSCAQPETAGAPAAGIALQHRLARDLAAASPPADPADTGARDTAAEKLSHLHALLAAADDRVLWGGFDAAKGYDPAAYRLTAFSPGVWVKLYLSTFMFPGSHEVRSEGRFTVLEMEATFRDALDAGDYPYPFWHSQQKWRGYVEASSVLLVFERDRLVAAYRKAAPEPSGRAQRKDWDGRWVWTDASGATQPRVALFTYLLSADNPHLSSLDAAYRQLEERFRAQNCLSCHAPDNTAQADTLLLLDFPNQALAGRHTLAAVLRANKMPPRDAENGQPAGIHDEAQRQELIRLVEEFEREADAALGFEERKE